MSHTQGNDMAASDRNATTDAANPPTLPTPTENTDIDLDDLIMRFKNCIKHEDKDNMPFKDRCITKWQFKAAIEQKLTDARIDGAKAYNRVLTDNIGKPTYMDDDGERHTVYKQVWVGDAIRKANAECISLQASKEGKEALCIESWYKCEFYVQGALPGIVDSICSLPHRMSNLSLAMVTDLASTDPDTNTSSSNPSKASSEADAQRIAAMLPQAAQARNKQ